MIGTGIAILTGLTAWVALQIYYWGRGMDKAPDIKMGWRHYVAQQKSRKGGLLFLAGIIGMACCYCLAKYYGLVYVNCIRNEIVFPWLLLVALIDGKEQIIPHGLTLPGFVCWVFLMLIAVITGGSVKAVLFFSLGGCLLGGGVFLLCRLFSRGGVGMGDIRVFGILGLLYGMNAVFSIVFFTILLMSVFGLAAVLVRKKEMKSQVPMGPFIFVSYVLCCILGV